MSKAITRRQTLAGFIAGLFGILGLRRWRTDPAAAPAAVSSIELTTTEATGMIWLRYDADSNLLNGPEVAEAVRRQRCRRKHRDPGGREGSA